MIEGDVLGEVYPLSQDSVIIGRAADVDLVLSDNGASRQHLQVTSMDSHWLAIDLGSTNGTYLNAEKLNTPTELQDGDKIRISDTTLKFSFHDSKDTEFHRQLRERATRDGLTQAFNQGYFMEIIAKEFNYAERHGSSLGLALIDIDHFKRVNDTYGHAAGDYILKTLCSLIEEEAREYDTFARIGGEEFAFLLRDATTDASASLAERIRAKIETGIFEFEENRFKVTISIGIATFSPGHSFTDNKQLFEAADKQLYKAKNAGRNQVAYVP